MRSRIRKITLGLLLAGVPCAWSQWGQQIGQRGFVPGTAFDISNLDSVDTVNGNVVVRIPVATLPAGHGGLGVNVTLTYNSGMYDTQTSYYADPDTLQITPVTGNLTLQGSGDASGVWSYGYNYGLYPEYRAGEPVFTNGTGGGTDSSGLYSNGCVPSQTGGIDTSLSSLSALLPLRMHAVFPDGSSHVLILETPAPTSQYPYGAFYSESDGWSAVDDLGFVQGCLAGQKRLAFPLNYITTDGTLLRVTVSGSDSNTGAAIWTMLFPDGRKITGEDQNADHIYDPNGNAIAIAHTTQSQACYAMQGATSDPIITLKDSFGRCAQIEHGPSTDWITQAGAQQGASCTTSVVSGCLITKVNFTSVGIYFDVPSTYGVCQFGYGCAFPGGTTQCLNEPCSSNALEVASVDLSEAGFNSPLSYSFTYNANGDTACQHYSASTPCQGQLTGIALPHGSAVSTPAPTIQYVFNPAGLIEPQDMPILSKTLTHYDPYTSQTLSDQWSYSVNSGSGGVTNSVTNPDGSATNYYAFEIGSSTSLTGHTFKVDKLGAGGSLLSRDEQYWQFNMDPHGNGGVTGQYNPYVKAEFRSVASAGQSSPAQTAITIHALDVNGNTKEIDESDWVNYSNVTNLTHGSEGDIEQLPSITSLRQTINSYYVLADAAGNAANAYWNTSAPPILDAKKSTEVLGRGVATAYSEFVYDDSTGAGNAGSCSGVSSGPGAGNVICEWRWDSMRAGFPGAASSGSSALNLSSSNAVVTKTTWNLGDVQTEIDPRGIERLYSYGSAAHPYPTDLYLAYGSPVQQHWQFAWDPSSGLRNSETDPNSATTTVTYDLRGRQQAVNQAGLHVTTTTYADATQTVTIARGLDGTRQVQTISTPDDLGRLWSTVSTDGTCGTGIQTIHLEQTPAAGGFSYKLESSPFCATSDATMGWTRSKSDPAGRVVEVAHFTGSALPSPWGSSPSGSGASATSYDSTQYTVTDEASVSRTMTMDGLHRVKSVLDGTGVTTSYAYDALDDLTGVTQSSQQRSFVYTSLGRLQTATNPESGTIHYTWDDSGNPATRQDARGITTTMSSAANPYDGLNRVTLKSYSDGTPSVTYCYEGQQYAGTPGQCMGTGSAPFFGRLSQEASSASTTTYTGYDAVGRVTGTKQTTGGPPFSFTYAWNMLDGLTQEGYPSGRVVIYGYDNGGEVNTVSGTPSSGSPTTAYAGSATNPITYTPHHAISTLPLGSGITETWSYNDRLQTVGMKAGSVLALNFYPCDGGVTACTNNNGNIWREKIQSAHMSGTATQEYRYDTVNRLAVAVENPAGGVTATTACGGSTGGNWCQQFGYDGYGNRWVVGPTGIAAPPNMPQSSGSFDGSNHLTANGGLPDAAGNVQQVGGIVYSYDAENRLKTITSGSTTIASYTYDAEGRRVQKVAGAVTTTYAYDAAGELAAEQSTGATTAMPCATCYLTADHLGSTRMITDASGNVMALHDFQPFGEEIPGGIGGRSATWYGLLDDPKQKFTGKERDSETANSADPNGLDYFGARYYSSAQGRFTSPDWSAKPQPVPYADLTNPQSLNLYNYMRNNPLGGADPDGHCCWDYMVGFAEGTANRYLDNVSNLAKNGDPIQRAINGAVQMDFRFTPSGADQQSAAQAGYNHGDTVVGLAAAFVGPKGETEGAAPASGSQGPTFVVSPGGDAITVPNGASGPTPVVNPQGNTTGSAYTGGSGGPGLDPKVSGVRIMDPTSAKGSSPGYPNGYVTYQNSNGQGVNPQSGRTVPNSDPSRHIPLSPPKACPGGGSCQ